LRHTCGLSPDRSCHLGSFELGLAVIAGRQQTHHSKCKHREADQFGPGTARRRTGCWSGAFKNACGNLAICTRAQEVDKRACNDENGCG